MHSSGWGCRGGGENDVKLAPRLPAPWRGGDDDPGGGRSGISGCNRPMMPPSPGKSRPRIAASRFGGRPCGDPCRGRGLPASTHGDEHGVAVSSREATEGRRELGICLLFFDDHPTTLAANLKV